MQIPRRVNNERPVRSQTSLAHEHYRIRTQPIRSSATTLLINRVFVLALFLSLPASVYAERLFSACVLVALQDSHHVRTFAHTILTQIKVEQKVTVPVVI